MRPPRTTGTFALAAALAVAGVGAARAEPPATLDARIQRLESEVAALSATPAVHERSARRAEAIRALVVDVLADADTRIASPGTAGHDDEFFIMAPDIGFRLELAGSLQLRYAWNRQRVGAANDTVDDFLVRRAKITARGILANGTQMFVGVSADDVGDFTIESAYVRFAWDETRVTIGRTRLPFLREESVSSRRQLAAERSLVARTFRQTRRVSVNVRYRTDDWQIRAGVQDGSDGLFGDLIWRASARTDILIKGKWSRLQDFTSFRDDSRLVAVGAGVLYEFADFTDPTEPDTSRLRWTGDVSIEVSGANAFVAVVGEVVEADDGTQLSPWAVVAQGGWFLKDDLELFTRFEWGDAAGQSPDLTVLTLGVNRYLQRHEHKWTLDVGYGMNEIGRFWNRTGTQWRRDADGNDGQVLARIQLQLLF